MPQWQNLSADTSSSKLTAALINEEMSDKNAEYGFAESMDIIFVNCWITI